jgi:hypothetical protein
MGAKRVALYVHVLNTHVMGAKREALYVRILNTHMSWELNE